LCAALECSELGQGGEIDDWLDRTTAAIFLPAEIGGDPEHPKG